MPGLNALWPDIELDLIVTHCVFCCLDILSIEFAVCNPFQCEIIPLSVSFDQLIPEAEVSNAESKSKNKPSKQPFHPSNLHSLCQADFKGGATGEKTWSLGRCIRGEFEFFPNLSGEGC